jgi:hypothetical protein
MGDEKDHFLNGAVKLFFLYHPGLDFQVAQHASYLRVKVHKLCRFNYCFPVSIAPPDCC